LKEKKQGLDDRLEAAKKSKQQALDMTGEDGKRKLLKAKRQWEQDEKIHFEKIAASKAEQMKKAAADSFGPRLDRIVMHGKEMVRKRCDDIDSHLLALKHQLEAEMENRLSEELEKLRGEMRDEDERVRRTGEKKLEDCIRKHSDEVNAIKERYARERKLQEESAERTRRQDAESNLETLREVRRNEALHLQELLTSHQRDLASLATRHSEEKATLQRQLREEEDKWLETCRQWRDQVKSDRMNRAKASAMMRAASETDKVLQRLRDEVNEERRRTRTELENEVADLRVTVQTRLDALQVQEQRALERSSALRGETEALRKQLASLQDTVISRENVLEKEKAKLAEQRLELRTIEAESEREEARREEETSRRRQNSQRLVDEWKAKEKQAFEEMQTLEVQLANKKDDVRAAHAQEIATVRTKINSLLAKKDATARELQRQLADLQEKCGVVQEALEQKRESKFGLAAIAR